MSTLTISLPDKDMKALQQLSRKRKLSVEALVRESIDYLLVASPLGVSGQTLLAFAGHIPADQVEEMRQTIAEGCEQIDIDAW